MTIRMAILAGVSSDVQAGENKESIPDQIKTCRRVIEQYKGIETACYVFDGYSRSGYDSLSDAMNDIPPLKEAIEAAENNQYDVLLLDSWDRLGDLGQLVYTRFRKHRKQIYSARQSGQMYDPATYDPSSDESGGINMHVQAIIQTYRINKIRRGWSLGVPARVENGLHALRVPWGYKHVNKDEPAQLIPEIGALLIQMKDRMLAGEPYASIGRWANENYPDLHPATWLPSMVKRTLLNPFYAGIVRFGVTSKRKATQKSTWKYAKGKHEALWDEATYHAIVAEVKRRAEGKRNFNARYPLSGLTVCGICNAKINRHGDLRWSYMYCHDHGAAHWFKRSEDAFAMIVTQFIEQYQAWQAAPYEPQDLTPLHDRLKQSQALRAQIQSDREAGIYTQEEAVAKINRLEDEQEGIKRLIEEAEERNRTHGEFHDEKQMDAATLENYIYTGEAGEVNHLLTKLIYRIVLTGDQAVVEWRE